MNKMAVETWLAASHKTIVLFIIQQSSRCRKLGFAGTSQEGKRVILIAFFLSFLTRSGKHRTTCYGFGKFRKYRLEFCRA
ncbi:hypothetical protein D0T49_02305 [Paludibacter sp. 221]|nr:hypothetical protein [Paludibacter sp. 221]